MYRYILFDLDGTLTDSKDGIIKSLKYAFDKLGDPALPDTQLLKFIGPPLQDSYARFCGYDEEKTERGIQFFRERYNTVGCFENAPVPGGPELCERLKAKGYILALASSKPEEQCLDICEKFGYSKTMDVITGSAPGLDWEKVDVIRETMRRLGLTEADKDAILMVGDRKFDALGAKACGIHCLGVEFCGYAEPGELEEAGAAAVVRTMEELEAYILNH